MEKYSALELLFETGLRHLYNSEKETLRNLKILQEYAATSTLTEAFFLHSKETEAQIERLNTIFKHLKIDIHSNKIQGIPGLANKTKEFLKSVVDFNFTDRSKGMEGIIQEGNELLRHFSKTDVIDLALVDAAQKVEQFEIGCYKFLILCANYYKEKEVVELLRTSLNEEEQMAEKLLQIAQKEIVHPPLPAKHA